MSSTKRGTKRNTFDTYLTPPWIVRRLLEVYTPPGLHWFDPCAGEGAIIRTVQQGVPNVRWTANEIRSTCHPKLLSVLPEAQVVTGDFLQFESKHFYPLLLPELRFDVILTNPPFLYAQEFIELSCQWAKTVAMLLRLNFLGSLKRNAWLKEHTPDIYVIPDRPSFDGDSADSVVYAWFVWDVDKPQTKGQYEILSCTPLEERKRDREYTDWLQRPLVPGQIWEE